MGNREQENTNDINDFKDLRIWQQGIEIAEKCYLLTKYFPQEELYGIVQQIRKSAVSIPANIAEGSINELETHLIISQRVGLCDLKNLESITSLLKQESRMITALIKKLKK